MAQQTKGKLPIDRFAYHDPRKEAGYMYQSTEVVRTQETPRQGSWYANPCDDEQGGIAVCFTMVTSQHYLWTMSISSAASTSWLNGGYSSGVLTHQRNPVEEL